MTQEGRYGTVEDSRRAHPPEGGVGSSLPALSRVRGSTASTLAGEQAPLHPSSSLPGSQDGYGDVEGHRNSRLGSREGGTTRGDGSRKISFFTCPLSHRSVCFLLSGIAITLAFVTAVFNVSSGSAHTPALPNLGQDSLNHEEYDFIIVGGGPAGSVLARRLSDEPQNRVLLLEAGMPSQYEIGGQDFLSNPLTPFDIPLMWPSVSHMKDFHWEVMDHTKREHRNALVAKALGGCGIHNAMLYVRALESDFIKWDVEGFDYASAMEAWKAGENYTGPGPLPEWHGQGGPISTSPPTYIDEVAPFFLRSCEKAGVNITEDFNQPGGREGAGYYHFAVRNGVRDSAARAMLGDIVMGRDVRTNLDIVTGAHVNKVLIEGGQPLPMDDEDEAILSSPSGGERNSNPKAPAAIGVEYELDGKVADALIAAPGSLGRAGSAVIVTAGALFTPKVLMKSGIGNKAELKEHGLDCIVDVPELGKNLQDHASVGVMYMLGPGILKLMPSAYTVAQELERYKMGVLEAFDLDFPLGVTVGGVDADDLTNGEQNAPSLFSSAGLSAGAFLKSPYASHPESNSSAPDIQLTVFPRVTEPHILALADIRPSPQAPPMMLVTVAVLDPEGRSAVRLNEEDPRGGNPHIETDQREGAPRPLSDLDAKKLAWGVGQVRKIARVSPLLEELRGEVYPGPGVSGAPDDTAGEDIDLVNWTRAHVYANSHWCGTARMGKASDPKSVVDERMKVKGVDNLFVGDASVIPYIPNGNVHATVVLVASRLAAYLLKDAEVVRAGVAGDHLV